MNNSWTRVGKAFVIKRFYFLLQSPLNQNLYDQRREGAEWNVFDRKTEANVLEGFIVLLFIYGDQTNLHRF